MLCVEPLSSVARWYSAGANPRVDRAQAAATLLWETPEIVFVLDAMAHDRRLTKSDFAELRDWLRGQGVRTVRAERHGRVREWGIG